MDAWRYPASRYITLKLSVESCSWLSLIFYERKGAFDLFSYLLVRLSTHSVVRSLDCSSRTTLARMSSLPVPYYD